MEAPLIDVAGPSMGDGPRVIVVAVDESSTAWRAASYATGLARRNRSALVFVHVRRPSLVTSWIDVSGVPPLDLCDDDTRGLELLAEVANATALPRGVAVTCALRLGTPAVEIARVADEVHADAVVVGSSRSRLRRLMCSIPHQLERRGAWPITVVP